MTRRVIPIRGYQPQLAEAGTAEGANTGLMGVAVVILHLASLGLALSYF